MDRVQGHALTREEAEQALLDWAVNNARRDELVRAARRTGVPINRIHTLSGIGRPTIYRILDSTTTSAATAEEPSMTTQNITDQGITTLPDAVDDVDGK